MQELLRRLFSRPRIAAELIAAALFSNLLALAPPLFVIQVLNRYLAHGVDATLFTLTVGVVLAVLLEFGFRQVRMRLAAGIGSRPDQALAAAGFAVLTNAKVGAMDRVAPALRREFVSGAEAVQSAYSAPNINAVLDVPFALLFVGVLFLLNPVLAVIAAVFLATVFLVGMSGLLGMRARARELVEAKGKGDVLVGSAIHTADTVRAFNAAGFLHEAWRAQVRLAQALARRVAGRRGLVQSFIQSAGALMSVAVFATGATLVVAGELDVGVLIGANILATRAMGPVARFAQLGESFAKARQALSLYREFSRLPVEKAQGSVLADYRGGIEFKDVAFAYHGSATPLFESLSLELAPGAVLVVAGGNGTGKTTLARLIAGLLEPTRGHILVDGVDLRQIVSTWWRRQIVYLPQEPGFLDCTIRDNLRTLSPDIDDEGLNRVISAAGLRHFIDETPHGLDAPLVDSGRHLSLGIRRRLALARALTSEGRLGIFDEPTEGLDRDGCAAVYTAMNDLAQRGCTIIAFSHDPNILKGAQAVLDLNSKPVPKLVARPVTVANELERASS